jgi:hypothetical protein
MELSNDGARAIYTDDFNVITIIKTDDCDDGNFSIIHILRELMEMAKKKGKN